MTVAIIFLSILTVFEIAGALFLLCRTDELEERQQDLDKYSVYLDERANRIAADEMTQRSMMDDFSKMYNEFMKKDVHTASYTETDADVMRYTTDRASASNAKKRLAETIANDIVKEFAMKEDLTDDGRKRFYYRFKIVQQ